MAQLGLEVKRAEQWVYLAIDRSGSMSGARLAAAKEGASEIVKTLHDGDMFCLFTFNHEVVRHIQPTEVNPLSKIAMLLAIQNITADGRTALYDAVLATSQDILKRSLTTKLLQAALSDEEKRRFVLVVLTDGADVCSKHNIRQTRDILSKLNSELGKEVLVIHFIGVKLDRDGEKAMKSLSDAAGDSATYEPVESTEAIKAKFHEISLGLSLKVAKAQSKIDWAGFLGRHVRIVKASRGMGKMHVGAVGVVSGQDSDGDYRVNFLEQDNWCAGSGDIEIDLIADQIRPGVRVRVKRSLSLASLKFGKGPIEDGMVGLVTAVSHDGKVEVDYGFLPKNEMTFLLHELEPVYTDTGHWKNQPVQCGQAVKVKDGISEPSTKWGGLHKGDIGFARHVQPNGMVQCNFPRKDGWVCKPEELQVCRVASLVKPGEKVRVKRSVGSPACGWGDISHESIGTVRSISYDGKVQVDFPSRSKSWQGHLCELEPIPAEDLSMPDLKKRAARKGLSDSTINACKERRDLEGLVSKGLPQEVTPLASAPLLDQRPPAINPAAKQNEEQAPCCEVPTAVPTAAPPRTKDVDSTTTAGSSRQEGEMAAAMALAAALGMALASDDEQDLGFHTGRRVLKGRCVGSCCDCQTRCGGQCNDKSHCNGDCQWSCCGKKGRRASWPGCSQAPRTPGCRCCIS